MNLEQDTAWTRPPACASPPASILRCCANYGRSVEVRDPARRPADVREALWVCEASGDAELAALARELRLHRRSAVAAPRRGTLRRPRSRCRWRRGARHAWAQDTSGFGLSRPAELSPRRRAADIDRQLVRSRWTGCAARATRAQRLSVHTAVRPGAAARRLRRPGRPPRRAVLRRCRRAARRWCAPSSSPPSPPAAGPS